MKAWKPLLAVVILALVAAIVVGGIRLQRARRDLGAVQQELQTEMRGAADASAEKPELQAEIQQLQSKLRKADEAKRALEEDRNRLADRLTKAEQLLAKPSPPSSEEPAPQEKPAEPDAQEPMTIEEFKSLVEEVAALGLEAYMSGKTNDLVKAAKALGPDAIAELERLLLESQDATRRFAAAAIFEKLGDPAAIPALAVALQNDTDTLVRRMASHAVAFIGDDSGIPILQEALDDPEIGVRINSAFGLAKIKAPGGLEAYQAIYDAPTTDSFMKTAILGGFTLFRDPDAVPFLDRVYSESEELRTKLVVVMALGETPGDESAQLLEKIILAETEESVLDAAMKAYKESTGKEYGE